jgi:hypothetical protein
VGFCFESRGMTMDKYKYTAKLDIHDKVSVFLWPSGMILTFYCFFQAILLACGIKGTELPASFVFVIAAALYGVLSFYNKRTLKEIEELKEENATLRKNNDHLVSEIAKSGGGQVPIDLVKYISRCG